MPWQLEQIFTAAASGVVASVAAACWAATGVKSNQPPRRAAVPDNRKAKIRVLKSGYRYWADAAFMPALGSVPVEVAIG